MQEQQDGIYNKTVASFLSLIYSSVILHDIPSMPLLYSAQNIYVLERSENKTVTEDTNPKIMAKT